MPKAGEWWPGSRKIHRAENRGGEGALAGRRLKTEAEVDQGFGKVARDLKAHIREGFTVWRINARGRCGRRHSSAKSFPMWTTDVTKRWPSCRAANTGDRLALKSAV